MHFIVKMQMHKDEGARAMTCVPTAQEARRIVDILRSCHKPIDVYYEPYMQA